jgi:translocation and assembly module TamB
LKGSGFRFEEVTLATLALAGEGTPEKISFQGKTSGKVKDKFDLETRGILHVTSKAQTLELKAFGAHYKDLPLKLRAPAAIHRTATGYRLETLSLGVGGGQLDGSGRLENQTLTLKTDFKNLPLGDLPIARAPQFTGTATGSLSLWGPINRPQGSLNLSLDGLSLRDAKVSDFPPATLNAKAKLTDSRLLAELTLKGLTAKPFDARLNIPLTLSLSPFTGSLPSQGDLRGDLTGEIDLARTIALTGLRDQKLEGLLDFSLKFGGTVANPELEGGIQLNKGAYRGIRSKTAIASIRFQGPVDRPSGDIELRIEDVSFQDPQTSELPPARVEAKAELRKGRLKSNVTLQGLTAEPLAATLDIPLLLSFFPFTFSMPSKGEILGNLAGDLDLGRINTLVGPDYQIVKGHFGADFALSGTVDTPRITGQAKLGKGYYEYIPTGTVLRDAEVEITAEIPRMSIKEARATDGEKGAISLNGWFDLLPGDQFPFKTALTLEQATLLRRDDITATAGGRVILTGSVEKANLAGEIHVEHAEVRIPDRLPPDITDLQVIEVRETGQQGEPPPQPRSNQGLKLFLDVAVDGPGKIFVRGRGLDSEWKCALRIAGTAHKPLITGNLSVVRGRFDFLGKRFDIRRGTITFNGAYPPSPIADIVTEARATDITAQLQLSGSIKNPKLTLTSDPPLPPDEILSRVLFGRTLTAITPFQALTLADTARTLAGSGGPGVMEKTRNVLGVDQLELKTDGKEIDQATVGAGKYLSDRVYLEVEQGMDPQGSKAKVQVEVTPNITVESEVGANSEGGMGVRWKWDY